MKILLSTTPTEGQFVNWTTCKYLMPDEVDKNVPLGILSLATNLSDKYDIEIIDPSSDKWGIDETIDKINEKSPDVLGLSTVTRRTYAMKEILKNIDVPYVAIGGPHATYYAKQMLGLGADAVFRGSLSDLEFNKAMVNLPKGVIDCHTNINDIKYPDRNLLDIKKYFPTDFKLFRANNRLTMFSSIGCPNRCNFCNVQLKKIQYKKPEIIMDEIEHLQSVGCKSVHILDDNFNINKKHVTGMIDEMKKRDFDMEWSSRGQVKMDLSLIPKLKERGFKRIHVGIESLDNKILKFFNKNETVKDIYNFCIEMARNDIDILGYFILGSPMETHKYRMELPDKIRELGIKHPFINVLYPEPDTDYYNQLVRDRVFKKDYWKEYMKNPTPNYKLPYPYGEDKEGEIWEDFNYIMNELKYD